MISSVGAAPSSIHAGVAVHAVAQTEKNEPQRRDDVVAPVETTNSSAARNDVTLFKSAGSSSSGHNVDITV